MPYLRMLPAAIHNFRQAGYEVWMDDFGSGYSSLNYLKNFEFDEIKLDMIFMKDFDEASKKILYRLREDGQGPGNPYFC